MSDEKKKHGQDEQHSQRPLEERKIPDLNGNQNKWNNNIEKGERFNQDDYIPKPKITQQLPPSEDDE